MSLYESLTTNKNFKEIFVHEAVEDIIRDRNIPLEKILNEKPQNQFPLFVLNDGYSRISINYRYMKSTNTFRVSGIFSLADYKNIKNLIELENKYKEAYSLVNSTMQNCLSKLGLNVDKRNKDMIDLGYGRNINGNGTFFTYNSNEYINPKNEAVKPAVKLIEEEIAVATASFSAMYDIFNIINTNNESNLLNHMTEHFENKIYSNNQLIKSFLDHKSTALFLPDLELMKKADNIIGINEKENKQYTIN